MATFFSTTTWEVIDSIQLLKGVLTTLNSLPNDSVSLFVDLEGIRLGRSGSLSLLTLHVSPTSKIFLDIFKLGEEAFTIEATERTSIKSMLESEDILKVFFDVRNDSDALFSLYGIQLRGVIDLQVMEFATRRGGPSQFVTGLANCIKWDCSMAENKKRDWLHLKDRASRLYDPKKGGRYEVFNERPLSKELDEYSAQDVALLPKLLEVYSNKLKTRSDTRFWQLMTNNATLRRIKQSQSKGYDGQAESKKFDPWSGEDLEKAKKSWNNNTLLELI